MIVVGGEALVDLVPTATDEPADLRPRLGGGPFNVAIALGRLAVPVRFVSRISTDAFGEALCAQLAACGVDQGLVQRAPEPTPLAVVTVDGTGAAHYRFYLEATAAPLVGDPGPLPTTTAAVSLGTLSLVLPPGAAVYETMLRRESRAGRLTVVDPNIRAEVIADPAEYRRRFTGWLPYIDILKVSLEDARWLAAGDEPLAAARRWLDAGPAAVVITCGADGMQVVTPSGPVAVPARRVEVVDTIGAGDAAHAAVLAWLWRHSSLRRGDVRAMDHDAWRAALDYAAAVAGIGCSRRGADPPWAVEVVL